MVVSRNPPPAEQELVMPEQKKRVLLSKAATAVQNKRTKNRTSSRSSSNVRQTDHILFGRGKGYANSPGNQRMHRIIYKYRGQYIGSARSTKRRLLRQAYREIIKGGVKVMKQGETKNTWVEVEAEEAMRKVGHSMRWRKGNIEESSTKPIAGPRIQGDIPRSNNETARPQLQQGIMEQQRVPSMMSKYGLPDVLLRHAIALQQQQHTHNLGIPFGALPTRMTSSLVHQLELERLQSVSLIERVPIMQPAGSWMTDLHSLQSSKRDQELLRIFASCQNMFLQP